MPPLWYRLRARVGGVAMPAGFLLIGAGLVGRLALPDVVPGSLSSALELVAFLVLLAALVLAVAPVAPGIRPRQVGPPVAGRWTAVNNPASKVPSHGVHSHGQTFAIDLVYEPRNGARPEFGHGPPSGRRRTFRPSARSSSARPTGASSPCGTARGTT